MIEAVANIGKQDISMKQIADDLGMSYDYFAHKRMQIARKNGYHTFIGFLCDYVRKYE